MRRSPKSGQCRTLTLCALLLVAGFEVGVAELRLGSVEPGWSGEDAMPGDGANDCVADCDTDFAKQPEGCRVQSRPGGFARRCLLPWQYMQMLAPVPERRSNRTFVAITDDETREQGQSTWTRSRSGACYSSGAQARVERVPEALEWLKDHQHRDGRWRPAHFAADTERVYAYRTGNLDGSDDTGIDEQDFVASALTLLAYVQSAYDHKEGEYRATCRRLLTWIRSVQDRTGLGAFSRDDIRAHAIGTLAIVETIDLSLDRSLHPIAISALQFLVASQSRGGGWSSAPGLAADLVTTSFASLALKASEPLLESDAFATVRDSVWSARARLRAQVLLWPMLNGFPCYDTADTSAGDDELLRAAAWLVCLGAVEEDRTQWATALELEEVLLADENAPSFELGTADTVQWWFTAIVMRQRRDDRAASWAESTLALLSQNQRVVRDLEDGGAWMRSRQVEYGSWDAVDRWKSLGGRVMATAVCQLVVGEVYLLNRLRND